MKSEKEIFISSCGKNKSVATIETKFIATKDDTVEEVDEKVLDGLTVNIFKSLRYTLVDLTFEDSNDYDFVQTATVLRNFSKAENGINMENGKIPCIQLTIAPKEFEGDYYITGVHGTWCLMASKPDEKDDTVRFIFENDLIHSYHLNQDTIAEKEPGVS